MIVLSRCQLFFFLLPFQLWPEDNEITQIVFFFLPPSNFSSQRFVFSKLMSTQTNTWTENCLLQLFSQFFLAVLGSFQYTDKLLNEFPSMLRRFTALYEYADFQLRRRRKCVRGFFNQHRRNVDITSMLVEKNKFLPILNPLVPSTNKRLSIDGKFHIAQFLSTSTRRK